AGACVEHEQACHDCGYSYHFYSPWNVAGAKPPVSAGASRRNIAVHSLLRSFTCRTVCGHLDAARTGSGKQSLIARHEALEHDLAVEEHIVPVPADQHVIAGSAVERVVSGAAEDGVVTGTTGQHVV